VLRGPKITLVFAAVALVASLWPLQHIGGEFMPRWTRATCCTCRRRCPGLSTGKASELLQQTDR
jgi:Cu(I)/Ag(I) efflux system membrane protein CusA/SilA